MAMGEIAEDAKEPGIEGGMTAEAMSGLQGLEECFLDQILGFGFIAAEEEGRAEETVAMELDEGLKIEGRQRTCGRRGRIFRHVTIGANRVKKVQCERP